MQQGWSHVSNMSKVFITDGYWHKTLAVVRSLGEKGIDVTVGESTRLATALFSRYARRRVISLSKNKARGVSEFS